MNKRKPKTNFIRPNNMVPDFLSPSMEHHVRALEMGQFSPGLRTADGDSPEVLKFLHGGEES